MECHGNTLLPQFLGMYRLTVDGDETYMIVTRNVFSHRLSVYKKYDLKVREWKCYNTLNSLKQNTSAVCSTRDGVCPSLVLFPDYSSVEKILTSIMQ